MKRLLLFSLLFVCGALALQAAPAPYQTEQDYEDLVQGRLPDGRRLHKEEPMTPEQQALYTYRLNHPEKVTLMPLILSGQPVKISVYPPFEEDEVRVAQQVIREYYDAWFKNALDTIHEQHRDAEFADVLDVLERSMSIEFVEFASAPVDQPWPEHVWVEIFDSIEEVNQKCGGDAVACEYNGDEIYPMHVLISMDNIDSDVLHELGHTLGLGGAYENEYKYASKIYRSKERNEDSVMSDKSHIALTADDADGLINLIDLWKIKMVKDIHSTDWCRFVPKRVREGWNSLYQNEDGKPIERYMMGGAEDLIPSEQKCPLLAPVPRPKSRQRPH